MTRNDEILVQVAATIYAGYIAGADPDEEMRNAMRGEAIEEARRLIKDVLWEGK